MQNLRHRCLPCFIAWTVLCGMLVVESGMPSNAASPTPSPSNAFEFVVFGDMPYTTQNVDRDQAFIRLIAAINAVQPAFSIHVGDIKSGSTRCDDATFEKIKAYFMTFQQPLVYTPGDNDWTDCHRTSNGAFDPLERLEKLRALFFPQATSLGKQTLALTRQSDVSAFTKMVENARWAHNGLLFVTVHVVGSNNNLRQNRDAALEFSARNQANLAWLSEAFAFARTERLQGIVLAMHAELNFQAKHGDGSGFKDTLDALSRHAAEFGKPVLIMHGDSHAYTVDQPLPHPNGEKSLDNVVRLAVFGDEHIHAVRVLVRPNEPMPFTMQPLFVPENVRSLPG
jgi:hypothetical protein